MHRLPAAFSRICRSGLAVTLLLPALAGEPALPPLPDGCRQVILVTTASWKANRGTLRLFERRQGQKWLAMGLTRDVGTGRDGLAWGRGLHANPGGAPEKREGDSRAPAGIFALGPAFGSAAAAPDGTLLAWRHATTRDFFVDDPESEDYNRWVRIEPGDPGPETRWRSFERMLRPDSLYEFGVVVHHNRDPVLPDRGSAIFLHVWKGPGIATAGCTAMGRADMLSLLAWLDPAATPLLIQIPEPDLPLLHLSPALSRP